MDLILQYETPEEQFARLYDEMYTLCQVHGWGDPFSYSRAREIYLANVLGHRIHSTYSGPDGYDREGAVEYKSTIGKRIQGVYNGISVQDTWEEQFMYLRDEKIGCYKWHYFARFVQSLIVEVWKMSGDKVLELLLPSLYKKYMSTKSTKDPRLGALLNAKDIMTYGHKIDIQ